MANEELPEWAIDKAFELANADEVILTSGRRGLINSIVRALVEAEARGFRRGVRDAAWAAGAAKFGFTVERTKSYCVDAVRALASEAGGEKGEG